MKLLKLIHANIENWKDILISPPYSLKIDEKSINGNDYILLKYNQVESDLSNPIVQECRGIILRTNDLKIVCYPFKKFFNYGEGRADTIDFNTAKVQEKIDGSIIKLWFDKTWIISTNGKIDAEDALCATGRSFKDLFLEGLRFQLTKDGGDYPYQLYESNWAILFDTLNKHREYTYIFEMVHPLTRLVVRYDKADIRHIGTRDNNTFEELNVDIGIQKPKEYTFKSLEEVVDIAKHLPLSEEGYVIVDAKWNRVKAKSPAYVATHHLKNDGVLSAKRVMNIILAGEQDEVLALYPEFTEYFNVVSDLFNIFVSDIEKSISEVKTMDFDSKKDFAMFATKTKLPEFFFNVYDEQCKYSDLSMFLFDRGGDKIAKKLKLKDKLLNIDSEKTNEQ